MADDNEDQWLYGDSNDGKDSFTKDEPSENDKDPTPNVSQDELQNIEENNAEINADESTGVSGEHNLRKYIYRYKN